jgi:hypothetical protein
MKKEKTLTESMVKILMIAYLVSFFIICHLSLLSCNDPNKCLLEPAKAVLHENNFISKAAKYVSQQSLIPL